MAVSISLAPSERANHLKRWGAKLQGLNRAAERQPVAEDQGEDDGERKHIFDRERSIDFPLRFFCAHIQRRNPSDTHQHSFFRNLRPRETRHE